MIDWLEKNRYVAIILTVFIAIEIFYFSSIPGGKLGTGVQIPGIATAYHFIVFFLFNFILMISIKGNKKIKISYIVIALVISVAYAFLDEFHQRFTPFREPAIKDILTDTVGIFSSTIVYLFTKKS